VESRSHELQHFTNILRFKFQGKLAHQALPRHLRRRAMAHNFYRIPLRIRARSLYDMKGAEAEAGRYQRNRCRRHRRKLPLLLQLYELRKRKGGRWMETHIWHAKRFKMENAWGVRYPLRCSDKSDRSTYRLTQKDSACIMDKSYFTHLRIETSTLE